MTQHCEKDDRHGKAIGGIILLGVGLVFLLSNLEIIPDFREMWPLILVVVGIALLAGAVLSRDKQKRPGEHEVHGT